ncbi:restriction endonuclease subunit S [Mediterraneibacter faecis]|uniref:restriction endonuclease subunit S n=1 Tax=Mediterraneibacter faecis TaxID=592978 RepID=UPI003266616A
MAKPTIRFKGYTEDWEQRKLGDIYGSIGNAFVGTATPYYAEQGHFYLESNNVKDGQINHNSEIFINDEFYEKQKDKWLHTGDMVMVQSGHVGHAAVIPEELDNTAAHALIMFRNPKEKIEPYFLNYEYQTDKAKKKIENITTGNTIKHILASDMQEFVVDVPKYEEQKVIAGYFCNIDHLITLHHRKCEETKILKKYMLQKMFPQDGQKVPEIRFKGFTEDWEQRKFGEITELKSASRVHKDEWTLNGVPFYRSSDVMAAINGTENEKAFISEELYEKLSKVSGKLEEGDILVTGGGSVGNPYIVPDNKPLYTKDADLLWIKNKGKFHPYFLYEFFFSPTFRNYLGSISHVGTIAHYTITQLSETPICLPSFEEQKEVGEYFQSLDKLITLHQRKCEELKNIKKFMLQNMFV